MQQVLQFLVGDFGSLGNQEHVMMRLRLDSTSAQSFFARWGPGKAKRLSIIFLWTQQAKRKQCFHIGRISTKENLADLNTKALSKERREFLMKRIGLMSENFDESDANYAGETFGQYDHGKQSTRMWRGSRWTGNHIMEFENCDGGDLRADGFGGETFLQADDKDGSIGQVQGSLENSPRISSQQADPFSLESKGNSFAEECEEEKNNVDEDKTVSESAFEVTPVEGADRSEEAETRRHRIIRQEGENGAADDDPEIRSVFGISCLNLCVHTPFITY